MRNNSKIIIIIMVCAFSFIVAQAQKITRTFDDESLAAALRQLNEESADYTINFIYDDLEDFRVSTSIKNKPLPEAIRQMIGFYPISMTIDDDESAAQGKRHRTIFVECVQKASRRYTGTVLGEQGRPLPYANVVLFSPADTTLLTGGVSNEAGRFVIPCEAQRVLMRVTCIGYKPVWREVDAEEVGIITLLPEQYVINGITVKGEQPIVSTEGGRIVYDMARLLEMMPADDAYEALTHIPGVADDGQNLTFSGQPLTLVIDGKPTTLTPEQVAERLKAMPAAQLAQAEIMVAAPARFHVRGAVLNIVTKDFADTDRLAAQVQQVWKQDKHALGQTKGNLLYNHGRLGVDAMYSFSDGKDYGKVDKRANHLLNGQRVPYKDNTHYNSQNISHNYRLGLDYALADDHRLSAAYTGQWAAAHSHNTSSGTERSVQDSHQHYYLHNLDASYSAPFGLQVAASYTNYQNPRTQYLDGELLGEVRDLSVDSRQRISKWLLTADQTHQLHGGWSLSYGAKLQATANDSYQTTLGSDGKPLADATSSVDYHERIVNAYAGLAWQSGKRLSVEASLAAEQYRATMWNEWRLFPTFNAMWNINTKHMLNLSFSSEAVYPSYWSTMSSIYYASSYSEIWGNPNLKPSKSYDINLLWQIKRKYTLSAFADLQPDYFVQLAYQPADRMVTIMKETNFDYSRTYGLQATAQLSAGKWLTANVRATGLYRHDKSSAFFNLPFDRTRLSAILGTTTVLRLSQRQDLTLTLSPFFQTKCLQGIYDIDPLLCVNASLRWTSPNGKWTLVAKGSNVFNNTVSVHSRMAWQDYTMRVACREHANAALSAIWRIGSFKEKQVRPVDTSRMGY